MKIFVLLAIMVASAGVAQAQEKSHEQQISEALMPLPDDLRAGVKVIGYDAEGKRVVLRRGTNNMTCIADSPAKGFSVWCYTNNLEAYRDRVVELLADGATEDELRDILDAEVESGKIHLPDRAVAYTIRGAEMQNSLPLMLLYLPGATSESTGLSTTPNHYRPWLMFAGTRVAHIMISGK